MPVIRAATSRPASLAMRVLLIAAFGLAGAHKILSPLDFRMSLVQHGIGFGPLQTVLATVVPTLELGGAILLALNLWSRQVVIVLAGTLVVFTVVSIAGDAAQCGCFPFQEPSSLLWLIGRNAVLLAACLVVAATQSRPDK